MNIGYYVSVIDGKRKGLLLGPYASHEEALGNVQAGKALACKADTWADFYAFGTCKIERDGPLPKGVFTATTDRPLAAPGLTSYRYKNGSGYIMIGAWDIADALSEANRSLTETKARVDYMQIWDGFKYINVV